MSSASSAVTYTSVYTDSEPGRVFRGSDEEISDGGSPRVIVLGYNGLPMQPIAPPSPDYILGPEDPQTPPPIYPEYIPLEHEHEFLAEEQSLPPLVLPTAESPGYVIESDLEEDPEEYEDDETEDGPVDYPIDGGEDGDDDDGNSSRDDADDEDEDEKDEDEEDDEEEEHLAPTDFVVVVPTASISLPPEAEVERLLATPTPPPSPPILLSPPSTGERLARIASTQALVDAVTAVLLLPPLPPLPPPIYLPPPVDRKDDIPKSERPPHKRLCLSTLGSRYEVGESSTARPTRGRRVDYGFVSTLDAEERRRGIREVGYGIRDTWVDPTEAVLEIAPMTMGEEGRTRISQRVSIDSQRVDLLMEDRIVHQETIQIVEEEAYCWDSKASITAKRNQERVKSILLLAIPDEYLLKFHNVTDAKSLWAAIKARFGGNEESKKMQKNVLKHQFENFTTASNESRDKAYDMFQKLISQLEVHGDPISKEDINQKVYEDEMKRSSSSTSTSQNLAFLSSENTSSTNEVSTASGDFRHALSLHNQQPVLNLKMRIFSRLMKMTGRLVLDDRSGRNQGRRSYGDNGRSNAPTNESSSQALNYDSEREKHSRARLEIQGYELALESLESRILVHEKNELAWGEKYEFQNYELKCREIKINNLNLELEKVVKERDELKVKDRKNGEESSKNLDELISSQWISSDEENTPANDRFSKADGFHVVPPPITGNFLTPRADISFADELNFKLLDESQVVLRAPRKDDVYSLDLKNIVPSGDFLNPFMAGSLPKTIKQSNDPPLSRGYTLGSGEDSLELMELMANCIQIVYIVRKKNREICEGFDEIIDFLTSSHIYYALTENPIIFVSLIEHFWETAVLSTTEEGLQAISATIDGHEKLITEASLRRHLKLEDAEGISSLSNEEIFEQLAHMGSKKTAWDQFSSNIATTIICLATSRRFNFSKFILKLLKETASMPHDSPLNVVHLYGSAEGCMQQHDLMVLINKLNDKIDGLEKDLQQTKKIYSTALTKLVLRVKKLEYKLKSGKVRRKAKIVLSDDEEIAEDSSKQGRKISQIDEDPTISLVQDEGISWIPQKEEVHEKPSEMEISTASPPKVTKVSTAEAHVYTRRKAKDKGNDIMEEPATPKKVKKRTQVQLSMDEELARKMEEE
ncbi:hypothetical protein Tco_0672046 [Tanacetum coccineum]